MPEDNQEQPKPAGKAGRYVAIAVVLAALVPAGYLVLRNAGKVGTGPVPGYLKPVAPDTGLRRFRFSYGIRLRRLEAKYRRHTSGSDTLNAHQDSLAAGCSSAIAHTRTVLGSMDSCRTDRSLKVLADSVRLWYDSSRSVVKAFIRALNKPELDDDSLDAELKSVLSE
jgi:hypothetical protein